MLIVEDHTILRSGLKQILLQQTFAREIDEADNGMEALPKIVKNQYDMIIMDISMPGRDGIEILKEVKHIKPNIPVLMLSMYPEEQYAIRSLKAGASGYLHKTATPQELVHAVETVASGRKYVSRSLAELLALELVVDVPDQLHQRLSDREFQILCLIASGKTVKSIAEELSLSVPTISTYRRRILDKMNMKNNAELVHYAVKNGLV